MIRCSYVRGPGFLALISTGHSTSKELCGAECSIFMGASEAIAMLAENNPKELSFEAQVHTGPLPLSKVARRKAVLQDPRYRVVRRPRRKSK